MDGSYTVLCRVDLVCKCVSFQTSMDQTWHLKAKQLRSHTDTGVARKHKLFPVNSSGFCTCIRAIGSVCLLVQLSVYLCVWVSIWFCVLKCMLQIFLCVNERYWSTGCLCLKGKEMTYCMYMCICLCVCLVCWRGVCVFLLEGHYGSCGDIL